MSIQINEVKTAQQLKQFIHLPAKIHKNHSNWVPPIYWDDNEFFNPKKNRSFDYCSHILLLATQDNEVVGRIMGLINHKYNQSHNEQDARFSFMETYNDVDVAHALIQHIEIWAKERGMKNLVGPLSFSDKDPQGMMVDGFSETLVIATNCNFPYQPELLTQLGFEKKVDLVTYKIDIPKIIPPLYQKIFDRKLISNKIRVVEFKSH